MKQPKVIAHYLPQFHRIPENDAWWGEGFTEWTAAKAAKPIFHGHCQPRRPLNDYYYDLLDKSAMEWQVSLAKKYGVDVFSFYHYWFKNGRKILEKPAENLLEWTDIDISYCFNWANESWTRTWSKLNEKNVWADLFDGKQKENDDDGLLLEQTYGTEQDWLEHIRYLIPFFKDKRYLKKDGKPVFILYHPDSVKCLFDMLECWEDELKKEGFPGIYIIAEITSINKPIYDVDSFLIRNPSYCSSVYNAEKLEVGFRLNDYDAFWQALVHTPWEALTKHTTYLCGCVDFDNTPRRGEKGWAFKGVTTEKFEKYFGQLYQKAMESGNDFVFLNAWNEWGEGMYLEPDTENGFGYLEAIRKTVDKYRIPTGKMPVDDETAISHLLLENTALNKYYVISKETQKLYDKWMEIKEKGKNISEYLLTENIQKIAIYGAGNIGRHLFYELSGTEIEIAYFLDGNETGSIDGTEIRKLDRDMECVDCIINTVVGRYDVIRESIKKFCSFRTLTIEHIISEI